MIPSVVKRLFLLALVTACDASSSASTPVAEITSNPSAQNLKLTAVVDSLRAVRTALAGESTYIVIDRTRNRLLVRRSGNVLLDATCATGSGKILFGNQRNQTWQFKTPRRVFTVQKKVTDPVWKKPVWAFVEKNESIPVLPWEFRRLDGTTLGAYALELEDSYQIHGTLYPNLLGRSITHGCVRLNARDLEQAYRLAAVGTSVYVF